MSEQNSATRKKIEKATYDLLDNKYDNEHIC